MKFCFSSAQERDPDKGRFSIQREFKKKKMHCTDRMDTMHTVQIYSYIIKALPIYM